MNICQYLRTLKFNSRNKQRESMYRFSNTKIYDKTTLFFSPHHTPSPLFTSALLPTPSYFLPSPYRSKGLDSPKSEGLKLSRVLKNLTKTIWTIQICENGLEISPKQAEILLPFVAHQIFLQNLRSEMKIINYASCLKRGAHIPGLAPSEEEGYPNKPSLRFTAWPSLDTSLAEATLRPQHPLQEQLSHPCMALEAGSAQLPSR